MTAAQQGDTVKVHYTGRLDDGTPFDSSDGGDPLEFTLGGGQIIPGFEEAVVGMEPGQDKTVTIDADQAYGPVREELQVVVDRSEFPENVDPEVGQRLQIQQPNGATTIVTVTETNDESVTLDANHPLAGKELTFDLRLVEII
jgi:FKBP-type peptidyl-prolyl cis-trans isomerase 2